MKYDTPCPVTPYPTGHGCYVVAYFEYVRFMWCMCGMFGDFCSAADVQPETNLVLEPAGA